jgi:hypothetical protein
MNSSVLSRWEKGAAAVGDSRSRAKRGQGIGLLVSVERELEAQGQGAAPAPVAAAAVELSHFGGFNKFNELHENHKKQLRDQPVPGQTPSPVVPVPVPASAAAAAAAPLATPAPPKNPVEEANATPRPPPPSLDGVDVACTLFNYEYDAEKKVYMGVCYIYSSGSDKCHGGGTHFAAIKAGSNKLHTSNVKLHVDNHATPKTNEWWATTRFLPDGKPDDDKDVIEVVASVEPVLVDCRRVRLEEQQGEG